MRVILRLLVVAVAALGLRGVVRAEPVGNSTCPVMTGEPVTDSVYEDYEGRRIYFCCTKCQAKFRANPVKYVANLAGGPATGGSGKPESEGAGDASRLGKFVGRLHPLTVHFPVALLIVAGLLSGTTATRHFRAARDSARLCVVLGAVFAVAAAGMGWLNARYEHGGIDQDSPTLSVHRWLGVTVAVVSVLAAVMALRAKPASAAAPAHGIGGWRVGGTGSSRRRGAWESAAAGLVLAGLVGVTGHYGGLTAYGTNYLWEAFAPAAPEAPRAVTSSPILVGAPGGSPSGAAVGASTAPVPAQLRDMLFSSSDLEVFKIRRAARLAEVAPPADPEVDPRDPTAGEIDRFVESAWRRAGLAEASAPPPLCDDATYLRRVYLDIIGVIPTIAESDRFLNDAAPDKRAKLVDELLARDQDYADHWTPFWEDALGSSNVQMQGGVPTRGNYRQWINDAFRENRPFDVFAAQLIDTEIPGAKKPEIAEANTRKSKISYVRNESHTDTLQSAAAVAQVFMGTGMKCASCHSHFENDEWPQKRFLAYAGLFGPHDLELIRCEKKSGEFVPAAFAFELSGAPADTPGDEAGRLRRAAQLLTDPQNPRFAKAIVNRLWKRYLGLGLFEPVDDFRLNVPPSHPELLEWLAYDFMSHEYDLKHTIRLILNSRTYQRAYNPALEDHFDVAKKLEPRSFRSPALRRLTAEQVVDSLRVAATQKLTPETRLYHKDRSTSLTRALGKPSSRNEISTLRPDDTAVVQALELLNGEEFNALVYASAILGEAAEAVRGRESAAAGDEAVARLYRAFLTRAPSAGELALATTFVQDSMRTATPAGEAREVLLIDDDTPANANVVGDWRWVRSPVSKGSLAHQQTSMDKAVQHFAVFSTGVAVSPLDTLFVDVYLDPKDPPKEVMLQWNDGRMGAPWDHRAFWGQDLITFGDPKSPSDAPARQRLGALPETGKWVHLEIPATQVGFTTPTHIMGISFDQFGGTVTFDNAGLISHDSGPEYKALGDLVWALASGPEFHYVK